MKSHMLPEPEEQTLEPVLSGAFPQAEGMEPAFLPEKPLQNRLSRYNDERPVTDMPIRSFLRVVLAH